MYTVTAVTYYKDTATENRIDRELALRTFNAFISCSDCAQCEMINGLTGEVLFQWRKGKFIVLDGVTLH